MGAAELEGDNMSAITRMRNIEAAIKPPEKWMTVFADQTEPGIYWDAYAGYRKAPRRYDEDDIRQFEAQGFTILCINFTGSEELPGMPWEITK